MFLKRRDHTVPPQLPQRLPLASVTLRPLLMEPSAGTTPLLRIGGTMSWAVAEQ